MISFNFQVLMINIVFNYDIITKFVTFQFNIQFRQNYNFKLLIKTASGVTQSFLL